jgi:predicted permease
MDPTLSLSAIVEQATSKKTVGAIVAIVMGTVFGLVFVFFAKERFIDKPRRERQRLNAMTPGMRAQAELATGRRNRTRNIV